MFVFSVRNEGRKHSPQYDAKNKSRVFVFSVRNEGRKHSTPHDAKNKCPLFVLSVRNEGRTRACTETIWRYTNIYAIYTQYMRYMYTNHTVHVLDKCVLDKNHGRARCLSIINHNTLRTQSTESAKIICANSKRANPGFRSGKRTTRIGGRFP